MVKLLQNRVAESRLALPAMLAFAVAVWLLSGLPTKGWWPQMGCFMVTTYLMVELNNVHALIRIYSRMVSCTFIALSCCACMLFPSLREALMQLFITAATLILFTTYQDKASPGKTYYAFVCFGLASIAYVHVVFLLPVVWLLTAVYLMSLSWRTLAASLLGLLTPYWFGGCWLLFKQDFSPLTAHFAALADFSQPFDFQLLSAGQIALYVFVGLLAVISTIHFIRKSYNDKIRTRMFYAFFIWTDLLAMVLLAVQPQHYDALMRLMILSTAPLAGHFIALTSTKLTNAVFILLTGCSLLLTLYNLWSMSSLS